MTKKQEGLKSRVFYNNGSKSKKNLKSQLQEKSNQILLKEDEDAVTDLAINKLLYSNENLVAENGNLKNELNDAKKEIKDLKFILSSYKNNYTKD